MNNKELLKKLKESKQILEKRIKYKKIYNLQVGIIEKILSGGVIIDHTLPFVISGVVAFSISKKLDKIPFHRDTKEIEIQMEVTETSTGIHIEKETSEYLFDKSLIYTTAWVLNEENLYERTIINYNIDKIKDNLEPNTIFKMTKEQLKEIFPIKNIETIKVSKLKEEDKIYTSNMILLTNYYKYNEIKRESIIANVFQSIAYIMITFNFGFGILILQCTLPNKINSVIEAKILSKRKITPEELEKLQNIIKIRQENINLLEGIEDDIKPKIKEKKI